MSTSLLYHGFGLREVEYKKTEYQKGKILFHLEPKPDVIRCATCQSRKVCQRGQKVRRFRSVPIGRKPVEILFNIPRVSCKDCGELRQISIPFADPRRTYTRAFERYALDLCRSMTIQDVAHHLGISWDVIKVIVKRDLQRRYARPPLKHLRQIAIDEIAIAKGHTYVTVVLDLETGAIVFVGEGKGAGGLATAKYGTATSPMFIAKERGMNIKVFADETRPLLQGARLTSWEPKEAGVPVTLICDNMAASVMAKGWIQAVIVGTDRVAANGDVANKIGTYGVAILAKAHGIPFYVAAPTPTIDMSLPKGADIPIEERQPDEITHWADYQTAPDWIDVYNPAFDVTPNEYVTALITEKGIIRPPYVENLKKLFEKKV